MKAAECLRAGGYSVTIWGWANRGREHRAGSLWRVVEGRCSLPKTAPI